MNENKKILGKDLFLAEYPLGADLSTGKTGDIMTVAEDMNLAQAILHRLRTIRGELADLGHPDYGSNIYDLVGEPNNQMTRDRVKVLIRDSLLEERRIKEIVRIEVRSRKPQIGGSKRESTRLLTRSSIEGGRYEVTKQEEDFPSDPTSLLNSVDIDITVIPIGSNVPLNIVFPFYLEVM
jgi:phage baseplate assembly protein W